MQLCIQQQLNWKSLYMRYLNCENMRVGKITAVFSIHVHCCLQYLHWMQWFWTHRHWHTHTISMGSFFLLDISSIKWHLVLEFSRWKKMRINLNHAAFFRFRNQFTSFRIRLIEFIPIYFRYIIPKLGNWNRMCVYNNESVLCHFACYNWWKGLVGMMDAISNMSKQN